MDPPRESRSAPRPFEARLGGWNGDLSRPKALGRAYMRPSHLNRRLSSLKLMDLSARRSTMADRSCRSSSNLPLEGDDHTDLPALLVNNELLPDCSHVVPPLITWI